MLKHVPDRKLLDDLASLVADDRVATATLLAHIAEVEARRLHAREGYPSMYEYCVRVLRLSEAAALKRIRAARKARRFPAIFQLVADGRLHLSGIVAMSKYLKPPHVDELLAAAEHKTVAEIEMFLANRFPRSESIPWVLPVAAACSETTPAPSDPEPIVKPSESFPAGETVTPPPAIEASAVRDAEEVPQEIEAASSSGRPRLSSRTVAPATSPDAPGSRSGPHRDSIKPVAPQRYEFQVTVGESTFERFEYVRSLLRHQLPSGDVAEILDRALSALAHQLERKKFGVTGRPRNSTKPDSGGSSAKRHIPASVRRAVRERDGGRCTFVSTDGHRCASRDFVEYDHILEFARGGASTVENVRLRCRTHNQMSAEISFGGAFMAERRSRAG